MKKDNEKTTTAVLLHIPTDIYVEYLKTLSERGMRRQSNSSQIFINAITQEIQNYNESKLK